MARVEKRRARRRRLTLTVALRRRKDHLSVVHGGAEDVDCVCELADTYFAKRKSRSCDCRKRKKGNPRVACGMCDIGNRDRIYDWRREARVLQDAVRAGRTLHEVLEPVRIWPGGKAGVKSYAVERRARHKDTYGAWYVYRRYRTEADRDNAVRSLNQNAWGGYRVRAGDPPRHEYRAAPGDSDVLPRR